MAKKAVIPKINRKKHKRISKHTYFMNLAVEAAKRSHDAQTQVGCILVSNATDNILGTGYNGFVRGANDENLPNLRPEKYEYIVHSEMNLLISLARMGGIGTNNTTLYCTWSPCINCMRMLYQAGITRVIVKNAYRDFDKLKNMKDLMITEKNTPEGYLELSYSIKK